MHIGAGDFSGKEIKDSVDGHPLSTRVLTIKESIFEIIGTRIHEASVLNINDRNGMYGIEAISRGAAVVKFLNIDEKEKSLVKENLKRLKLDPREYVLEESPRDFLSRKTDFRFDVIFLRVKDAECFNNLEDIISFQAPKGITVVFHPHDDSYSIEKAPKGYQLFETRSAETEKVTILLKEV